ncbi:MAG: hypothetical protein AAF456_05170 [Planctomycetota bacterium]
MRSDVSVIILPGRTPPVYRPGELLSCEYKIDIRPGGPKANAIETTVLWQTEGKGDTDIGVHFFERREKKMVQPDVLRQTHKLTTKLPQTPLSYDGRIVKIVWCIRVRIFFDDGGERTFDKAIRVGDAIFLPPDDPGQDDEKNEDGETPDEPETKEKA